MTITFQLTTFKRFFYSALIVTAIATGAFLFARATSAQEEEIEESAAAKIEFPVAELGNCADKQACKKYCDGTENRRTCFAFAKKHGLMKEEKIRKIEKRLQVLEQTGGGPGQCQSEETCEAYCSDVTHIKECVSFAKEHGIMEKQELEEAEKVQQAVERGARLPGGCQSKKACETHCSNPDNMEECLAFAEQAGFMKKEELDEAKRILPLMKSGQTPGGCRSKQQCEAFCENPDNVEECVSFAEKAGFMKPEEAAMVRKTGGKGPGGCRGRVECEVYCNNPDNAEQCFKFAEENGLIPPEELAQIKKAGGAEFLKQGGPGGCRGKRECEDFCKNPENQEACFKFAVDKGLIPPEEAEKIKQMGGTEAFKGPGGCVGPKECQEYCSSEDHQEECGRFRGTGQDFDEQGEQGGPMMRPGMGPQEDGEGGVRHFGAPGQLQFSGPGGCSDPKSCFEFCKNPENLETCKSFVPGKRDMEEPGDREDHGDREDEEEGMDREDFEEEGDEDHRDDPSVRERRGESPRRTPGDFEPPPGFGSERPGQGEFEVPPGFTPPGVGEKFEGEEGDTTRPGSGMRPEMRGQIEMRKREEFENRDEEARARFENREPNRTEMNFPEKREELTPSMRQDFIEKREMQQQSGEFVPRKEEMFERQRLMDRSEGFSPMERPEGAPGFNMQPEVQMQRPPEQFNSPPGEFEPTQSRPSSSLPLKIARKILGSLAFIIGL